MHTFSETGAGVPAFLAKLWRLVDDPETNNLICWSKDGRSFIIQNQAQFARELLPLNYKHNNMASFIRQLNMYGFHKITSIDNGGLKFDRDEMEFSHPCFKRNCPYLLEHIKRKIANTKSIDDKSAIKTEAVSKVLQDVKAMRGRQDSLDSRFSVMKQENEALWREIASLRQKHAKQQQIVNKLIQFLITIVQPSRNMTSVKRHMQLMINDTPKNSKLRKTSESESDGGPVIHELGEELLDDVAENELDLIDPNSPYASLGTSRPGNDNLSPFNLERPQSSISISSQNYDISNQSADDVKNAFLNTDLVTESKNPSSSEDELNKMTSSIIQSVNPDGSKIIYHVTEVPDAHPTENSQPIPSNYSEENVLTTPMVRKEMARSQLLKQKNKERRNKSGAFTPSPIDSPVQTATKANSSAPIGKRPNCTQVSTDNVPSSAKQIKSEQEIDPMLFLNVYPENRGSTPDKLLVSNINEDSHQSSMNSVTGDNLIQSLTPSKEISSVNTSEFYNPNDFISSGMPSDIFEDASLIGSENSNFSDKLQQLSEESEKQNQDGRNDENLTNSNGASTSAAAAAAASGTYGLQGKNALAVAKYKNGSFNNEEILRLSTADDVHGHLENVQDELDSLKDLLRGDGYSLDANTLLGNGTTSDTLNYNRIYLAQALDGDFFNKLFNDSDILGSYGLSLSNDNNGDKKGSELIAYQPLYDLSDIMDINDNNDLDNTTGASNATETRQLQTQSSVLNTPYRE